MPNVLRILIILFPYFSESLCAGKVEFRVDAFLIEVTYSE